MTAKHVLVVDDEVDFLATYERLLRREGLLVTAAVSITARSKPWRAAAST